MPLHPPPNIEAAIKQRLLALPPRAFELFAGDLLEFIGLRAVSVTRSHGDGGIDAFGNLETNDALVSIPIGVQVKRYRSNVQRPDIDRFIGALSGNYAQGMFITTAGYAVQAARKAATAFPRVTTVDGNQVVTLMLRHGLGVTEPEGIAVGLDEAYFAQFEAQAAVRQQRVREHPAAYLVETAHVIQPEDDLISLRALSHALRVDATAVRRWIEKGTLLPDQPPADGRGRYFFRRDRIEAIRTELLGKAQPTSASAWRQEFLDFARSRNLTKSYKPVLLRSLLRLVDRNGEAHIDDLVQAFRAFYVARREAGLPVEFGPPDPSDSQMLSDAQLRQLIVRHPLERFLIQGFLEYIAAQGIVRFVPLLWAELRFWELLNIERSADEQLQYYYSRLHENNA